jgi:NAD(P)-dependent dehydrogenase (short-subunit alcohol dehydrogenase family)
MVSTWFITGSSSGFGRLLTEQLLARGDRVAATARHPEAVADLGEEHGDRLWTGRLDVTDAGQAREVMADAFAALGTIDVVVSNAGYGALGAVEELADEQLRRVIDTNLLGSINVIRAALPLLRKQRHGRILQVSAAGGQTAYPFFGAYIASKWGIEGFCETVAREVAPFGVGVTIVEPGATPTGFGAAVDIAPALDDYAGTPAGEVRQAITGGQFTFPNDAAKIAAAMISLVDSGATPLRLTLGSDAYDDVHASLSARLAELERQHDVAFSVIEKG